MENVRSDSVRVGAKVSAMKAQGVAVGEAHDGSALVMLFGVDGEGLAFSMPLDVAEDLLSGLTQYMTGVWEKNDDA